jgi:hypothetical protein
MDNQKFLRLQISALNLVAFFGLVMHVLMATFEMVISSLKAIVTLAADGGAVDAELLSRFNDVLKHMGGDWVAIMMFVFIVLSLATVVLPLLFEAKAARWTTAILGGLLALMNAIDGATHIFAEGEVINGLYTLLISAGIGLIGTVLAFRWAREK